MDLAEFAAPGVDAISFAAAGAARVALHGVDVPAVHAHYEANMADALERCVVDAEHIAWKRGAGRLTGRPHPIADSCECGAPRAPGVLNPTSIQVIAHECSAPGVSLAEADVGEVAFHRRTVIAACGFTHAHVGHPGFHNACASNV